MLTGGPYDTDYKLPGYLVGRVAKCYCGESRPSTDSEEGRLAFFEFKGAGSKEATEMCVCGYHRDAHDPAYTRRHVDPRTVIDTGHCSGFRAKGPMDHDSYYCGCGGWD